MLKLNDINYMKNIKLNTEINKEQGNLLWGGNGLDAGSLQVEEAGEGGGGISCRSALFSILVSFVSLSGFFSALDISFNVTIKKIYVFYKHNRLN